LQQEDAERDRSDGLHEREQLYDSVREASERLAASEERAGRYEGMLEEVEAKYTNVLMLQGDAVKFTLQCLEDVQTRHPTLLAPAAADGSEVGEAPSLRSLQSDQREAVLAYLLEQLQAYQEQLKELELHDAWKAHTQYAASAPPAAIQQAVPPMSASAGTSAVHQHGLSASGGSVGSLPPIHQWSVLPPPPGALHSAAPLPPGSRGVGTEVVELGVQESVRPWGRRQEQPVRVKGSRY